MASSATKSPLTRSSLLTPEEVAELLQCSRYTAAGYMRSGVVPAAKIGNRWYCLRDQLEEHLAEKFKN